MHNIKKVLIKTVSVCLICTLINQSVLSGTMHLSPSGVNECNMNLQNVLTADNPEQKPLVDIHSNHKNSVFGRIWNTIKIDFTNKNVHLALIIASLVMFVDYITKFIVICTIPRVDISSIKWEFLFLTNVFNPNKMNIYSGIFIYIGLSWFWLNIISRINKDKRKGRVSSFMGGLLIGGLISTMFGKLILHGGGVDWIGSSFWGIRYLDFLKDCVG